MPITVRGRAGRTSPKVWQGSADRMEFAGKLGQLVRSAGVYTIGLVVSRVVSLLLLPVYTRYISPADNAVIEMIDTTLSLFSIIAGARFASAISYFYAHAAGEEGKREVVSTMMLGGGVIGAAGAGVGMLAAPWISQWVLGTAEYASAFRITFGTFAALIVLEVCWGWLRSEDRPVAYVSASLFHTVLGALLNILLLVVYRASFYAVLWSALISAAAVAMPAAVFGVARSRSRFNWKLFGDICRYAAPVGISGLAAYVFHFGERFFLRGRVSQTELGLYLFGYKLGMMVSFLQTGFTLYWTSQVYNHAEGENGRTFIVRVFTYFTAVMTYACFGLAVCADPVVRLLADSSYWGSIGYVPWIVGAYWLRAAADFFRSIFYLCKHTRGDAVVNVQAAVVCMIAYITLIPPYGIPGAIVATLLGFGALLVASYRRAMVLYPITLEWRRLGKLVLTTALLGVFYLALPSGGLAVRTATAAAVCLAFPVLLWALRFFNPEELAWAKSKLG